jgi:hypothetical protein
LVLSLVVIGAVYTVLLSQVRHFKLAQETVDARVTLRAAGNLLTSELRQLSAARGDLYAIAPQSMTLRSVQGVGVICDTLGTRYGVWQPSGSFQATVDDSTLIYSLADKTWKNVKVATVWSSGAGGGIPTCASWTGGMSPDVVVEVVPGDTAGLGIGSGIRTFRRMQYGIFQQNSRWWLGRRPASAGSYEIVAGPLRSQADSGLAFHYYDASGAETAVGSQVVRVEVVLRAESFERARTGAGLMVRQDSISDMAFLRN